MKIKNKILAISTAFVTALNFVIPTTLVNASNETTNIYVVWNCDGNVCVSDALTVNNGVEQPGGVKTFETNYIKSTDVKDTTNNKTIDPNSVTNKNNNITSWYIYETLPGNIRSFTSWTDLDRAIHEEDYDKGIDPTGGIDGLNSIAHNGDRNYRVVIYDESKYESLTFNVDSTNYTYYLGAWDPVFSNPTIDVSSTTEANPAIYITYLLENTLKFTAGTINKETISSVKALNVPDKALSITKIDEEYTIKFNSNYYSEVTFEITGSAGGKYYIKVKRVFMKTADNMMSLHDGTSTIPTMYAKIVYPDTKTYNDYDVIANITKQDGTMETRKLVAAETKDWDNLNPGAPVSKLVWDAGIKLKETGYAIEMSKDIKDIQITVTNKDATTSTTYGGTFGGNGKGVSFDSRDITNFINRAFN